MGFFTKKKPEPKPIKICFVKEVYLTQNGMKTRYFTEVNGIFQNNSLSDDKEKAEKYFDDCVEMKGEVSIKEVLKETII